MYSFNIQDLKVCQDFSVHNITGSVDKNHALAILGENGSGKSTLLKCLTLKYSDFTGSIKLDDVERVKDGIILNTQAEDYYKSISYFSQDALLWPTLNVKKNIYFSPKVCVDEAIRLIEIFELEHLLDKKAWQLSGGEKQRVSLARTIATKADVYLLDEPTNDLSYYFIDKVMDVLMAKKNDSSIILISHLPRVVLELADEYLFLKNGEQIEQGNIDSLATSSFDEVRKWVSYN